MKIKATRQNGEITLLLEGELRGSLKEFKTTINAYLDEGIRKFIIDFEKVIFMDSAALGVFASVGGDIKGKKGTLQVQHLDEEITEIFSHLNLFTVFPKKS